MKKYCRIHSQPFSIRRAAFAKTVCIGSDDGIRHTHHASTGTICAVLESLDASQMSNIYE